MTVGILQDNLQNVKFCERGLETWTSVVNIWLQSWQVWLCTCSMEGELKFTCEAETVYLSESSSVDCSYAWELDVQLSVTLLQMIVGGHLRILGIPLHAQHTPTPGCTGGRPRGSSSIRGEPPLLLRDPLHVVLPVLPQVSLQQTVYIQTPSLSSK